MSKPLLSNKRANRVAVLELKDKLREQGYDVGRSNKGHFSKAVVNAVCELQKDNKLEPTGIVGDDEWALLDGKPKKKAPAKKPAAKKAPAKKAPAKKPVAKKAPAKKAPAKKK
jgi:peptidoglycan hydrolase-like protein with peptidoglycan-binding domain